jgi:hypothetical protein
MFNHSEWGWVLFGFSFFLMSFPCPGWSSNDIQNDSVMEIYFPWCGEIIPVSYKVGYETFVYTSAYPQTSQAFGHSRLFVYYHEELVYRPDYVVILDPDPPWSDEFTFLDLYFNSTLREGLEMYLHQVIGNLTSQGIQSFVLGDEWPRGLNKNETTIQAIARYNQTYHNDTKTWIRENPTLDEKKTLGGCSLMVRACPAAIIYPAGLTRLYKQFCRRFP